MTKQKGKAHSCLRSTFRRGYAFLLLLPWTSDSRFFSLWMWTCPNNSSRVLRPVVPRHWPFYLLFWGSLLWLDRYQSSWFSSCRWLLWDFSAFNCVSQSNKSPLVIIYIPLVLFLWRTGKYNLRYSHRLEAEETSQIWVSLWITRAYHTKSYHNKISTVLCTVIGLGMTMQGFVSWLLDCLVFRITQRLLLELKNAQEKN
jgi:hypothetical protein